ncbi:hypothetical protein B0J13DRAFT_544473 [Dactylonectria estremocensis]|uniref:Myb-like domain-containing protein n=1 Tax=Dactylonectria estremocensis TaxID=1079267 RepID=A0A9P9F6T7_9HYPO|nr:hypothetical protein B0J13DRAFT_544473 [Dactylonectria estremocensis]
MNSKNWNDRADKELFFTILSVKNIGIISGAEWTTIGNHMRTLGYGFTNEGCRQHFQGLRRAQNKAEINGTTGESSRKVDPTMNPITRRPGPGRGRPRKQPPVSAEGAPMVPALDPAVPDPSHPGALGASVPASIVPIPLPGASLAIPVVMPDVQMDESLAGPPLTFPSPPHEPELPQDPPHLHPLQGQQPPNHHQHQSLQSLQDETKLLSVQPSAENSAEPVAVSPTPAVSLSREHDIDADGDEPDAKRQRLSSPDLAKDELDDEEAVLALAAHGGPADPFQSDFSYGEA